MVISMSEPYRFSNSEIQTFKDCRRRWYLTYKRGLKPKSEKPHGPLVLGTRVHEALDRHFKTGGDLLEIYSALTAAERDVIETEYELDKYNTEAELGRTMLEGFQEWAEEEGIYVKYDIVSTEQVLEFPLLGGEAIFMGKVDLRVRRKADGAVLVVDYKTAQNISDITSWLDKNEQALSYMLLEEMNRGEDGLQTDGMIFRILRKTKRTERAKPPFYEDAEIRHNKTALRSFWARLNGEARDLLDVKNALDAGDSHLVRAYPTPSRDCSWKCPFVSICPMFDDGSDVEAAISDRYVEGDPYDYYQENSAKWAATGQNDARIEA
jgi:RecB family exonuclease